MKWKAIFNAQGWDLNCVSTLSEAVDSIRRKPIPVVVYDYRIDDDDWREVLRALSEERNYPCVLLASSVIDKGFRDEVVRFRGYDVVSRLADEDELVRTINSAWFWKQRHA